MELFYLPSSDRREKSDSVSIRQHRVILRVAAVYEYKQYLLFAQTVFFHNIMYGYAVRKLLVPDLEPADLKRRKKLDRDINHTF